jgi:TonB family protein
MRIPHLSRIVLTPMVLLWMSHHGFAAQDPLQSIKDMYASAAYEDALSAVTKLDAAGPNVDTEQYRVFCLVALGRVEEADQAVENLLTARPEYRPDAADASPRIQALFATVRRRIGPALVKRQYQQARAAMERKEREEAIAQFETMLRIADDADIRTDASVAELKELGAGFLDLSRAMPVTPKPRAEAAAASGLPPVRNVIVPPTVIQQRMPRWVPDPMSRATEFQGAIRVQISAEGRVVAAEMVKSVHPAYDQLLLRAARGWSYEPARKDGVAIPMEKTVEVTVAPPGKAGNLADKSQPF